ncbi:MAG: hypothetical protein LUI60_07470 [Clostridia bacterium]|nr:hypothetical protein [Clostridia bacterium]
MGRQELVERILSDAESESQAVIAEAEKMAGQIISEARSRAEKSMEAARADAQVKSAAIADSRAATARLDSAKILLGEKRGVIDDVYSSAAKQLAAMDKKDCLSFIKNLLDKYAETGDEVVLADNFKYSADVAKFDIVKQKNLKLVFGGAGISGGFILRGKKSDRDLSIEALIAADRAEHEAEVAAELLR